MAAPTLVQILTGIQTRLATISGLRGRSDVFSPAQINPPQAWVPLPSIPAYHHTFKKGKMSITAQVVVATSLAFDQTGQQSLSTYMDATGTNSIVTAIEGDSTLGGIVDDCTVMSSVPVASEQVGEIGYYGATFTLDITADGI